LVLYVGEWSGSYAGYSKPTGRDPNTHWKGGWLGPEPVWMQQRGEESFLTRNETLISLIATIRRQSLNITCTRFPGYLSLSLLVISDVDKEIVHAGMLCV
jgi:hypothetical protein